MIRALVVDIDGTLSDENRVLCPAAVRAIRGLKLPVVLATGNTHCFTRTVCVLLGTPRVFIAENGGVVSHSEEEMEILADLKVCEDAFEKLAGVYPLKRYNSARYRFTDIALQRNFDVSAASDYARKLGLAVDLIDTTFAVHIKDRRVSKGTGLIRVAERMGIALEEFAAIGDSDSDRSMFVLAGFRASVGNASENLKRVSDFVAVRSYGDGFAEIIDHLNRRGMLDVSPLGGSRD